jgi:hypothetical protein
MLVENEKFVGINCLLNLGVISFPLKLYSYWCDWECSDYIKIGEKYMAAMIKRNIRESSAWKLSISTAAHLLKRKKIKQLVP